MVRNSVWDSLQRIALVIIVFVLLGIALAGAGSSDAPATASGTVAGATTAGNASGAIASGQPGILSSIFSLAGQTNSGAIYTRTDFSRAVEARRIALISGHAGNDSGAVCSDSNGIATFTEANLNAVIAGKVAALLQAGGASVLVLDEYDARIDRLDADLLLSLHADSCIDASGFKAARYVYSQTPSADDRLVACIDSVYSATTGLPLHSNTVTHNMTEYHAFRKVGVNTPAAILEMGFLGGDGALLQQQPDLVAQGVANAIYCFLNGDNPGVAPAPVANPPELTGP
jgi:N-acetylmuramoyl-L-alanine amidase